MMPVSFTVDEHIKKATSVVFFMAFLRLSAFETISFRCTSVFFRSILFSFFKAG
jgi:hypothetical protein